MERREMMGDELGRWWKRTQGLTEVWEGSRSRLPPGFGQLGGSKHVLWTRRQWRP